MSTERLLRRILGKHGLSQAEFARAIGLLGENAGRDIRRILGGKKEMSGPIYKICVMLDNGTITLDDLHKIDVPLQDAEKY